MTEAIAEPQLGVTVRQAARKLKVHFATVRRMLKRGKLRPLVVGGRVRVDPQSIDEMIEADSQAWLDKNVGAKAGRTPAERRRAADAAAKRLGIVIEGQN